MTNLDVSWRPAMPVTITAVVIIPTAAVVMASNIVVMATTLVITVISRSKRSFKYHNSDN